MNKRLLITPQEFGEVFDHIGTLKLPHQSPYYKRMRDGLIKLGRWRAKGRGNPTEGYRVMRANQQYKRIMHTIKEANNE